MRICCISVCMLFQEEKLELMKLLERVPIPIKESIEEPSAKVCITVHPVSSLRYVSAFFLVQILSMCFCMTLGLFS